MNADPRFVFPHQAARIFLNPHFTKVFVGQHEQEFGVHKELLCQYSVYFRFAYESGTQEAQQDLFRLPDIDAKAFGTLVIWLYKGGVYLDPGNEEPNRPPNPPEGSVREEAQRLEVLECADGDDPDYDSSSDLSDYADYGEPDIETDDTLDTVSETESEQPAAENVEAAAVRTVGSSDATELDVYQLETLIRLVLNMPEWNELLPRWEQMLAEKRSRFGSQDVTMVDSDAIPDEWEKLVNLYIVADHLDVPNLCNDVLDCIQVEHETESKLVGGTPLPSSEIVATAFARLPATSKLRQWLIDAPAYRLQYWKYTAEQVSSLPKEFLVSILLINTERAYYNDSSAKPDFETDLCKYHDHRNDEEAAACREARASSSEFDEKPDEPAAPESGAVIKEESETSNEEDSTVNDTEIGEAAEEDSSHAEQHDHEEDQDNTVVVATTSAAPTPVARNQRGPGRPSGQVQQHSRRQAVGQWWSKSQTVWDAPSTSEKSRQRWSHAGRLMECPSVRVARSPACQRCVRTGEQCYMYNAAAFIQYRGKDGGNKCAHCRYGCKPCL